MYQHRANFAPRDGGGDDDRGGGKDHDHDEHVHVNLIDMYIYHDHCGHRLKLSWCVTLSSKDV